jgi:hypothetical protein
MFVLSITVVLCAGGIVKVKVKVTSLLVTVLPPQDSAARSEKREHQ